MPSTLRTRLALVALTLVLLALGVALWWQGQAPAHLVVQATPDNARIVVGEHVATGLLEVDLPPGLARIEVSAPGHVPWTMELTMASQAPVTLTPVLQPVPKVAR